MAIVTVSGEVGCRWAELARLVALRLKYEFVNEQRMADLLRAEFGTAVSIPGKAWSPASLSVLARLGSEYNLVVAFAGAEMLFQNYPGLLRVHVIAREAFRVGNLMLDSRLERPAAQAALREAEMSEHQFRKLRFGRSTPQAELFDLVLNAESYEPSRMLEVVEAATVARELAEHGLLSHAAESQLQFQVRLHLAKHGIVPAGKASLDKKPFGHPSEELFANLLDFYHIAWEYEPRSFPLQWDKNGNVIEAFTPDFYLSEADLYVELTTMKQALVTKKNHKVKLLRAIYPHVNIQVFYQKDFQDLVRKYGLTERVSA
jgi:cytidylate kinase